MHEVRTSVKVNLGLETRELENVNSRSSGLFLPLSCKSFYHVQVAGTAVIRNAPYLHVLEAKKGLTLENARVSEYILVSSGDMTAVKVKKTEAVLFHGRKLTIKNSNINNISVFDRQNAAGELTRKPRVVLIQDSTVAFLTIQGVGERSITSQLNTMGSDERQSRVYEAQNGSIRLVLKNAIVKSIQAI